MEKIKTLYSLGDSFMTTDDPGDGIVSFCELFCQHKGFRHVSLARPGATNFSIRLQIERAIEAQADYVVVGTTCSDRFDIALDISTSVPRYKLDDVFYQGYRAQSEKHVKQDSIKLLSDTFVALIGRYYQKHLGTDQQLNAMKEYITYLHNPSLAVQKDYYIISDGLRKMQATNIDFILLPGWMSQHDWSWVDRVWPKDIPMPYSLPYGTEKWYDTPKHTMTHNPHWAHEEFCDSLMKLTPDWN